MGLYDTVICEMDLPDADPRTLDYQTKHFNNMMELYTIKPDGALYVRRTLPGWELSDQEERVMLTGSFTMYDYNTTDHRWLEYELEYSNGELRGVKKFADYLVTPSTTTKEAP